MKTSILVIVCLLLSVFVKAQNFDLPKLELKPFAEGFKYPIDLANAGDDRLFVVERLGKIWVIDKDGNKLSDKPFLNITDEVFTVFPEGYDEQRITAHQQKKSKYKSKFQINTKIKTLFFLLFSLRFFLWYFCFFVRF